MKKKKIYRIVAFYLIINIVAEICCPTVAYALTSGPAQPEMASFEPVGTSEMVDLFSGDFTYNIPLMDVDGYPINISYQSNITMDQEASWVGLGWNINPGAITRNMRGIPDDFSGDEITKEFNMKPNKTYGVNTGFGFEFVGLGKGNKGKSEKGSAGFSAGMGINYNNYTGMSMDLSSSVNLSAGKQSKTPLNGSLGFHSSAQGLTISPRIGYSDKISKAEGYNESGSIGTSFNSREGLKELTLTASLTQDMEKNSAGDMEGGTMLNKNSSISFGRSTYFPRIDMPMQSIAVTFASKFGVQTTAVDYDFKMGAFFSQEKLAKTSDSRKAYGYLNLQDAEESGSALLDFNREKDGAFGEHTSTLPLASLTYDSYNVTGQGMGGIFRPYRNDIGYVYDHNNYSNSDSYSLGTEVAIGYIVKGGIDISITDVNTTTGKWDDMNSAISSLKYRKDNEIEGFEPAFFKQAGELNVDADQSLYNTVREDELVRFPLHKHSKFKYEVTSQLETSNGATTPMPSSNYRTKRQNRNQNFSYITRGEYMRGAIDKELGELLYDDDGDHTSINAKKHHIGEITTTRTDGTRYVYGIAAYNKVQREVAFNASKMDSYPNSNYDCNTGLVSYIANTDNTTSNPNGQDNFFSATNVPEYAHSYLLTSVLSSDYVDITGNGPSNDDLGTYTKLNYKKTTDSYKWRVPYDQDKANFDQNLKTLVYDDQGNYVYGEKEIWFLESIETKNYIALFETAPRRDAFDVAGENGGAGSSSMHLLRKIALYTKPEYNKFIANPSYILNPIKEVHFEYDYSLCADGTSTNKVLNNKFDQTGLPNEAELSNEGGKLTLKKIYFTYSKSLKGKLSPYEFSYSSSNPTYSLKSYDRWGAYKPDNCSGLANSDFPYSIQDKSLADVYASSWHLKQIDLPSGGQIKVNYEADDYAYVQDKIADQMFVLTGAGSDPAVDSPVAVDPNNVAINEVNDHTKNYLYFELKKPIPNTTDAADIFRHDYLKDITTLYFRALVTVNQMYGYNEGKEYVSGYAEIFDSGLMPSSGDFTHGWIQLKTVCKGDNKDGSSCSQRNPISKAAWQFARIHTSREAYSFNNDPNPDLDPETIFLAMADASFLKTSIQTFLGANGYLEALELGGTMAPSKSWIRLHSPDRFKVGGGSRVKELRMNDNWHSMFASGSGANQESTEYGQIYDYTTIDPENGKVISSGVAQNEPSVGNDENPLKQPFPPRNADKQEKLLAPDDFQYQEEPIGESVYPGCSVGYSKVTVKNLPRYKNDNPEDGLAVKKNATGKIVYNYYTAKDFPVIAQKTDLLPKRGKSIFKLLKFDGKDFMTASQGFRIILNDMHGKLKSQFVYAEGQAEAISGMEYVYKTSGGQLSNSVTVINKNGSVGTKNVGVDFDFVGDFREHETSTISAGVQLNLYYFQGAAVPITLPPILPSFSKERVRFRSATATKVINKYGILDKTIAYDLGSKATTEYLAYDATTGEPLLTRTITNFDDNTYSFSYPAHFAYEGMSAAFKGTGVKINDIVSSGFATISGVINQSNPYFQFIQPGDEYLVYYDGTLQADKLWAAKMGTTYYLIDKDGNHFSVPGSTSVSLKIYRSGRRNMQSAAVGASTSFYNPLDGNKDGVTDATLPAINEKFGIIQAGAVMFSDQWKTFCECGIEPDHAYNPYIIGTRGSWRKLVDFTFLTARQQTKVNANTNIRVDGTFKKYSPFWSPNAGADWTYPTDLTTNQRKWTYMNLATEYSPYGAELENRDALKRYSMAQYGYNYTIPTAVTSNSKYKQSGFDGFEDYDFRECNDDHLGFKQHKAYVSESESHSGRKSIKVAAGQAPIKVAKIIEVCEQNTVVE